MAAIFMAFAVVSACAVGPDFVRPAAPNVSGYTDDGLPKETAAENVPGGTAQKFVSDQNIPAKWWELFSCEPLNKLMEESLKSNPDLQAASASLRQAKETLYASEGAFFPSVDVTGGATREKITGAEFGDPSFPTSIFTLYNASVGVSYPLDIFGGVRREVESQEAQKNYQRYLFEAAYLSLTGNVVTAAVQEASLREQIAQTQKIIDIESDQLKVLQSQFDLGGVAKTAVLEQQATLAQLQATLPPLQKQLAQKRNQLAVLSGHFPSEKLDETFNLETLHLPADMPVSMPSKLVEQRPDVRAAEEQLHSASALIGVATSNMLPQVTLTGNWGTASTSFSNVFTSPTDIWSIGAGLTQPIFQGGTLLHERRAAVAAYDKAAAQYKSTVLAAFQNVADSLRALQYDASALSAQVNSERAAKNSLDLAQDQFKVGAISYLSLLDAERTYNQARIALVQAEALRFADTAALFQALGGGWWNRHAETAMNNNTKNGEK